MRKKVFLVTSGLVNVAAGFTVIRGLGMGATYVPSSATADIWRIGGMVSNLYLKIAVNTLDVSATITTQKNGSAGNQSILIGAGLTGEFYDSVNSDTVVSGDSLVAQIAAGAGTGGISPATIGVVFTATDNLSTYLSTNAISRAFEGAGADQFSGPGLTDLTSTEAHGQVRIPTAGTMKNLFFVVTLNGDPSPETITSRINGVDGTLVLSIPSMTTGAFEDTTHSDVLAENDLYGYRVTRTGSVAATAWGFGTITVNFESTNGMFFVAGGAVVGQLLTTGLTRYFLIFELRTLEADQQYRLFNSHKFDKLRLYLTSNATTSPSTFDFRKNEVSTALAISIGAGLTGAFTDDTNSVFGIPGDRIVMRFINGGGGNLTMTTQSMRVEAAPVPLLPGQLGFHPLNMV